MGIIEMEEIKGAINEVLEQSEYNGGGIDDLKARSACKGGAAWKRITERTIIHRIWFEYWNY